MYSKIKMIPRFASRVEIWNFFKDSIVSQFPEETEPPPKKKKNNNNKKKKKKKKYIYIYIYIEKWQESPEVVWECVRILSYRTWAIMCSINYSMERSFHQLVRSCKLPSAFRMYEKKRDKSWQVETTLILCLRLLNWDGKEFRLGLESLFQGKTC